MKKKICRSKQGLIPDHGVVGKVIVSPPESPRRNNTMDPAVRQSKLNLTEGDVVGIKNKELRHFLNKDMFVVEYIGTIQSINNDMYMVSLFAQDGAEILCTCQLEDLEAKR